jgi:hypothetical protein
VVLVTALIDSPSGRLMPGVLAHGRVHTERVPVAEYVRRFLASVFV